MRIQSQAASRRPSFSVSRQAQLSVALAVLTNSMSGRKKATPLAKLLRRSLRELAIVPGAPKPVAHDRRQPVSQLDFRSQLSGRPGHLELLHQACGMRHGDVDAKAGGHIGVQAAGPLFAAR
jgi:hypothetical protein